MQVQLLGLVLLGIATRDGHGLGQIQDNCGAGGRGRSVKHRVQSAPGSQRRWLGGKSHPGLVEAGDSEQTRF